MTGVYINRCGVLLSFHQSYHIPFRFPACTPFPSLAPVLTKERTPAVHSPRGGGLTLHASDCFMVVWLPVLHRSQAHLRNLCPNDKAITRARFAGYAVYR